MRPLVLAALLALTTPAIAEEETPLVFSVTPSGVEGDAAAARERLEALVRRREAADYRFRGICVRCGGQDRWAADTVNPIQALGGRGVGSD